MMYVVSTQDKGFSGQKNAYFPTSAEAAAAFKSAVSVKDFLFASLWEQTANENLAVAVHDEEAPGGYRMWVSEKLTGEKGDE